MESAAVIRFAFELLRGNPALSDMAFVTAPADVDFVSGVVAAPVGSGFDSTVHPSVIVQTVIDVQFLAIFDADAVADVAEISNAILQSLQGKGGSNEFGSILNCYRLRPIWFATQGPSNKVRQHVGGVFRFHFKAI